MKNIFIIPFGEIEPKTLDFLARSLRETYNYETLVAGCEGVPEKTYSRRRRQYHATRILERLDRVQRRTDDLILGVIDEDLYVPDLNFVFGEADMPSRIAVIGLPRLRQEFYGLDPDGDVFLQRAAKEAIHEIGHTCGLGHCPERKCVMHFSNSLWDTDAKKAEFCNLCRSRRAA